MTSDRKFLILQAIIDDYIMTAMPVGSRTVSRKSGVGFSPATIRNEMSDLEELGYLDQPHTSAGRIPSAKAYRLYVDRLLRASSLDESERRMMLEHLDTRSNQVEEVIRSAAQVLSDITQYTAIISAPQMNALAIRRVQMVPVTQTTALLIIVTTAGIIKDAVIRVPDGIEPDDLYRISVTLTEALEGKPLNEIRQVFAQMLRDLTSNRRLLAGVMQVMEEKLSIPSQNDVVVGGSTNLLNYPEYSDVETARRFLTVLESRDTLMPLLRKNGGMEISIRIGPEIGVNELSNCSIVTATYRVGNGSTGTLGVIGPTRMNYSRVVSVLDFMGKAVSDLLQDK